MPRTNALASRVKTTGDTMTGNLICPQVYELGGTDLILGGDGFATVRIGNASGSTTEIGFNTSTRVFFPVQAPTASAPAYVKGGMYFDTTLNKLRIGGAAGWETVTSV